MEEEELDGIEEHIQEYGVLDDEDEGNENLGGEVEPAAKR
jgi:hypothetical protein